MGRPRKFATRKEASTIGALARSASLSPAQRSAIASKAAASRINPGRKKTIIPPESNTPIHELSIIPDSDFFAS